MKNGVLNVRIIQYRNSILRVIYLLSSWAILTLGYNFEEPQGNRKIHLLAFIIIYVGIGAIQGVTKSVPLKYILTFIQILQLILIELNSKYAINYFFHALYIVLLMHLILNFSKKAGLIMSLLLLAGSTIKFVELLTIQPTLANLSIFLYFLVIQILVLLVAVFFKGYKEENLKTQGLYDELLVTNRKLKAYAYEIKQLTMVEERTKIARDLHDTLGHDMTGLIMQMEMSSRLLEQNQTDQGMSLLEAAKKSARDSLVKIRQILDTLKNDREIEWTNTSVYELSEEFAKKTQVKITCEIIGENSVKPDLAIALYRIVQEALTNAVRHGKAKDIRIKITYEENLIQFCIIDNGKGCLEIKMGNGLLGMRERVNSLKGEVFFSSRKGFKIEGSLPYNQEV